MSERSDGAPIRAAERAVIEAAKVLRRTNAVYRGRPIGGEGSIARREQADRIAAEDAFDRALDNLKKEMGE